MRTLPLFVALCLSIPVHAGELEELRVSATVARGVILHEPALHGHLEAILPGIARALAAADQAARTDRARGDRLAAAPLTRLRSALARSTGTAHGARARLRGRRLISTASR